MIRFTPFNLITLILMGLTLWVAVARYTRRLDSNWPLVYWLLVVAHLKVFEGGLNPYWIYAGLVCALFLRFEFVGGVFLQTVRILETVVLGYIVWRSIGLVLMW